MIKEIMHHKEVIKMEEITNCVECEELRVKGKTHQDMWCGEEDKKIVQRSKNHTYISILTPAWCPKNDCDYYDDDDDDYGYDCYGDEYDDEDEDEDE